MSAFSIVVVTTLEASMSGNTKGGKYHCTIDLLLDWFGISSTTTDNFLLSPKQTNTNQSNRRSMVQWYFPFSISVHVFLLTEVSSKLSIIARIPMWPSCLPPDRGKCKVAHVSIIACIPLWPSCLPPDRGKCKVKHHCRHTFVAFMSSSWVFSAATVAPLLSSNSQCYNTFFSLSMIEGKNKLEWLLALPANIRLGWKKVS